MAFFIGTLRGAIILLPLTFKQQKSAKINAVIQPEILKIQKFNTMFKQKRQFFSLWSYFSFYIILNFLVIHLFSLNCNL